jgi:outer membrane protein
MKERISALIVMVLFGFWGQNASGQTDLTNLINYALEHNREIRKSDLQVQEANYLRKETIGNGLPQLEGSASYSKMMFNKFDIPASVYSMVPAEYSPLLDQLGSLDKFYMASAGVQVTQLIYSQAYWVGLKTTKKAQELYSILKTKNEEDIIAEVATTYYQAGSLMLQLQTIDKSVQNLKETYRIADLTYKSDLLKETNVSRLKVTITNLEVARQTLQNGIDIQLNYLKAMAGMPGDSLLRIDTTSFVTNFEGVKTPNNYTVENVPAFQALLKQNELYSQQINLSKANYYPTIAAYGKFTYASYNTASSIDKMNKMNTIGLSLSVPIFSSGVRNAKVKQAMLKQAELQEDILQTKDLLNINFSNALSEYQTSHDLLAVQKENRELAQKVYKQTLLQYKEGMASMADLLNVNSDFLQADNSYNQQILKCKTAEIKMLKASGNLKLMVNNK